MIGYCPAFRNTTHLEIISNEGLTWGDVNQLVNFPNLTHLCFDVDGAPVDQSVLGLLEHRPSLQAMVYQTSRNCAIEVDDSRFLVLQGGMGKEDFVAEWERSANGGNGLWELVDKIIEARKSEVYSFSTCRCFHPSFLGSQIICLKITHTFFHERLGCTISMRMAFDGVVDK